MKKLLVLVLVLGIASLASAAGSITAEMSGGGALPAGGISIGDVITVKYFDSSSNLSLWFDWDGGLRYAQDLGDQGLLEEVPGTFTRHVSTTSNAEYWAQNTTYQYTYGNGHILTIDLEAIAAGTLTLAAGQDVGDAGQTFATLDVTVVPEPVTMALLGLGGVFLARRKK